MQGVGFDAEAVKRAMIRLTEATVEQT